MPGSDRTVKDVLLEPTYIYSDVVRNLMRDLPVKGMVHITGGGFYDNIPRVLPNSVTADIKFASWDVQPVFHWLREEGGLTWPEMLQIFNCGIGYVLRPCTKGLGSSGRSAAVRIRTKSRSRFCSSRLLKAYGKASPRKCGEAFLPVLRVRKKEHRFAYCWMSPCSISASIMRASSQSIMWRSVSGER